MNVNKLAMAMVLCAAGSVVWAGAVAEKKAVQESESVIAESLTAIRTACGNESFQVKLDWKAYDKITPKFLKAEGRTKENLLSLAGSHVKEALDALTELCADADYKAEIVKLKTLNAKVLSDHTGSPYKTFELEENTLKMTYDPTTFNGSGETVEALKQLF